MESNDTANPDRKRFKKLNGAEYDRVNDFIRNRTYLTAREWAVLRVSQDLRTGTGVPTKRVGKELPEIVPFIKEEFSRQNVHNTRQAAREKTIQAGSTFLYATMSGAFDTDEVDDIMYDATEIARYVLEAEGADISVEQEKQAEEGVRRLLQEIREASRALRNEDEF